MKSLSLPPGEGLSLEACLRRQRRAGSCDLYARAHDQLDRFLLPVVLEHTQAKLQQAARLLGIARQTLRLKLRGLRLQVTHSIEANENDLSSNCHVDLRECSILPVVKRLPLWFAAQVSVPPAKKA